MKTSLLPLALVLALTSTSSAQQSDGDGAALSVGSFNPDNATAPAAGVEGAGVKVGEGTVLHPVVGFSTGAVSNVFYEENGTNAAGVLRILGQIGAGSLSTARLTPTAATADGGVGVDKGKFQYRASLRLAYDFILSGNDAATETGGLGIGATMRGLVNPNGPWSLGFDENLTRYIRAANFETDADTNRVVNQFQLNAIYHPAGRSISGYLYYTNMLDVFERDEQGFANRIQHRFGIHPTWQWLPKTSVYGDVSIGIFSGLGSDSMKVTSFPLIARAGMATLLTAKTTLNFNAGYTNGFYSSGPSYSGVVGGVQLGYRYSPLGRATLTYDLRYEDSVNSNYYRDHVARLWFQQMFVPFVVTLQPEIHFRKYSGIALVAGPPERNDVIVSVVGGVLYNLRNELSIGLDYRYSMVETDYRYMVDGILDDPGFSRHQLLLGMRWAL